MKFLYPFFILSLLAFDTAAQTKLDTQAIDQLCGCFEVDFKYAETFSPFPEYEYKDRYSAKGVELALPIEVSENKIVIQHLLVINDQTIIKHWREDWLFENDDLLVFEGDSKWSKSKLTKEIKGTWTQKVYGTSDEPRYEGSATWVHVDGGSSWYNVANSPLPRREYSKRSDYNIMERGNRIIIEKNGYTHEQDNKKVQRVKNQVQWIASEKGYNDYKRTDDEKCEAAVNWWKENEAFWADIREAWKEVLAERNDVVELKAFSRTKILREALADLQELNLASPDNQKRAINILKGFLVNSNTDNIGIETR